MSDLDEAIDRLTGVEVYRYDNGRPVSGTEDLRLVLEVAKERDILARKMERLRDWIEENRPIRCSLASLDGHDDAGTLLAILSDDIEGSRG